MLTCRDGKGGELSSLASKMLYSPPGAVNIISSYKESLNQSDCWKLLRRSIMQISLWRLFRAIECRLAQMNVFSRCLAFSANNCVFSLNEQQKVYFRLITSLTGWNIASSDQNSFQHIQRLRFWCHYNYSLSIDAAIMVSKNCPITGETLVLFSWQNRST